MDVNTMAIVVLLGSFFLMVLLRFPIAYAVALSSVLCLLAQGKNLNSVCQLMVKGISSFSLMAVPFFITMGCLMGSGGISEKLFLWRNLRLRFRGHRLPGFHFDSHDGGSGLRRRFLHRGHHHLLL